MFEHRRAQNFNMVYEFLVFRLLSFNQKYFLQNIAKNVPLQCIQNLLEFPKTSWALKIRSNNVKVQKEFLDRMKLLENREKKQKENLQPFTT